MHQNKIWLLFLAFLLAVTLFFAGKAAMHVWDYVKLDSKTQTTSIEFSIEEGKRDHYTLIASYTYLVGDQKYSQEEHLPSPLFRNTWSAEEFIGKQSSKPKIVWYQTSHPEHSSLQKSFPLKECISAGVIAALMVYFVGIGIYVARKQG